MRIGTWNMDGKGGDAVAKFLLHQECDVLLLTEVPRGWELDGYEATPAGEPMLPNRKQWSVVLSTGPIAPCTSPHPATAAAVVGDVTYVCSVLPWAGSGGEHPWSGSDHPARMASALVSLKPFLQEREALVWGGDWNQSLEGPERAGSNDGRLQLLGLLVELGLDVPTRALPHRIAELATIDHIAVRGGSWRARRVPAEGPEGAHSDHDLYIVE